MVAGSSPARGATINKALLQAPYCKGLFFVVQHVQWLADASYFETDGGEFIV
jgi:hypothetical protein